MSSPTNNKKKISLAEYTARKKAAAPAASDILESEEDFRARKKALADILETEEDHHARKKTEHQALVKQQLRALNTPGTTASVAAPVAAPATSSVTGKIATWKAPAAAHPVAPEQAAEPTRSAIGKAERKVTWKAPLSGPYDLRRSAQRSKLGEDEAKAAADAAVEKLPYKK